MIELKIAIQQNGNWVEKNIWEIFDPSVNWDSMTYNQQVQEAIKRLMLPTTYKINSETYCNNSDRTANYELEKIINVNYKSKPEFVWNKLPVEYLENFLSFIGFRTNYLVDGTFITEEAPVIKVTYRDIVGVRTIRAYLGQSIEAEVVEYDGKQYYDQLRLAFPER